MALVIDDPELEARILALAKQVGETPEQTVLTAVIEREEILAQAEKSRMELEMRLARHKHTPEEREAFQRGVMERGRAREMLDGRAPDEILGYNEMGVPK